MAYSESESKRFSLNVYRHGAVKPEDLHQFMTECAAQRADVIILRMESEEAAQIVPLLSPVCHTIMADQLLEFRKSLHQKTQSDFMQSGAEIIELSAKNTHLIEGIVERCYVSYTNHYHANPCLAQGEILQGLAEFSRGFIDKENRTVLIARYGENRCGYLCVEIRDGVGSTVIGGSALDLPPAARHKVLCDLTHFGDLWLLERKVREFKAVTRTDKIYIQKLLIHNMHCLPARSLVTIHLNLFLGKMQPGDLPNMEKSSCLTTANYTLRDARSPSSPLTYLLQSGEDKYIYQATVDASGVAAFGSMRSSTGLFSPPKTAIKL